MIAGGDNGVRFGNGDFWFTPGFGRQRLGVARAAEFFHGADWTAWMAGGANEGSEIHHAGLEFPRRPHGRDLRRPFPQFAAPGDGIDWLA